MLLQIQTRHIEPDITVVEFSGRIVLGAEVRNLETLVQDLLCRNEKKLIFDLTGLEYIDSSGIGVITLCFSMMKKASGSLRLAGAQGKVWQQFKMTRLDTVLAFYPTVEAACEGFAATPKSGG